MSISSRITEMEQHIGNAYDKIEDLGIDITDVDKNIDNISSMLENVWNEYPKVSVSDVEEASLDGTKKGRMQIDLKGNTEQEQLSGKNLLDYKTVVPATSETVTLIDNGFKVNGNYAGKIVINNLKPNTDYYLQYITENIVGTIKQVVVFGGTEAGSSSLLKTILNGTGGTFNTGSYTTINIWFYAGTGTKGEANFTNIQLEEGSTATSYEPYCGRIPAPNPSYEIPIHNVKGSNEFKIQNKNLFTLDNKILSSAATTGNNKEFTLRGNNISIFNVYKIGSVKDFIGKTLTINCEYSTTGNISSTATSLILCDNNGENRTALYNLTIGENTIAGIYTIPDTVDKTKILALRLYATGSIRESSTTYVNLQIEQGTTATDYVEHQEQNLPLNLKSKNLFPEQNIIVNNNEYTYTLPETLEAGNYTFGAELTGTTSSTATNYGCTIRILKDNTLVTDFQLLPNAGRKTIQKTIEGTFNKIVLRPGYSSSDNGQGYIVTYSNIELDKGNTEGSYVPYYNYELSKIDTAEDYFYKENGKWYINKETGKEVFDGSTDEAWWNDGQEGFKRVRATIKKQAKTLGSSETTKSLSNYYIAKSANETYRGIQGFGIGQTGVTILIFDNNFNYENSVTDYKTWLSTHNLELYYQLETPENIEITETTLINQLEAIRKAKSYNDQTNISQTNEDLPFILDIETLKK